MPSKKKKSFFAPTKEMYDACSWCFSNDIKAWIEPMGKEYVVVLDYQGKIKRGNEIALSTEEASEIIWRLYEKIHEKQKIFGNL